MSKLLTVGLDFSSDGVGEGADLAATLASFLAFKPFNPPFFRPPPPPLDGVTEPLKNCDIFIRLGSKLAPLNHSDGSSQALSLEIGSGYKSSWYNSL